MKRKTLLPIVIIIGAAILFFFPKPQENFILYLLTFALFITAIILILISEKPKK